MQPSLRFISLPTVDTVGTLLELQLGNRRYLFGRVAEGTQRAAVQNSISLVKTVQCFLTGPTEWSSVGGLVGLALTHCDTLSNATADWLPNVEKPKLTIQGAPGLLHYIAAGRKYILRFGGHVTFKEFGSQAIPCQSNRKPEFDDGHIRVWALPCGHESNQSMPNTSDGRKRKFERISDKEQASMSIETASKAKHQEQLIKTVEKMWTSHWKQDNLVEVELQDVPSDVRKLWVRDNATRKFVEFARPISHAGSPLSDPTLKVWMRQAWPTALIANLPVSPIQLESICYIVKTPPIRGKFLRDRAEALGIPKGPTYGKLTAGKSITLENGTIVTPDMVMEPERPSKGFVVIDIPSRNYLNGFLARPEWKDKQILLGIEVFFWILGPGLASLPEIVQFMDNHNTTRHIVASPTYSPNSIAIHSAAKLAKQLEIINPVHFRPLIGESVSRTDDSASPTCRSIPGLPECAAAASMDMLITIRPHLVIKRQSLEVPPTAVSDKTMELAALASNNNLKNSADLEEWRARFAIPDCEVVFLGTGSSCPSSTRNVTGILLRVPHHGNYILDCGEGTLGQLRRMFPAEEVSTILRDLRMVWISHIHADHHLGTIGMIQAWYKETHNSVPLDAAASNNPSLISRIKQHYDGAELLPYLPVVSNKAYLSVLQEYSVLEDFGFSRVLPIQHCPGHVDIIKLSYTVRSHLRLCTDMMNVQSADHNPIIDSELSNVIFGKSAIDTTYVRHCQGASAIAITFYAADNSYDPFKIAWSGDCRPSLPFAIIAHGADVLIHEATFGDDMYDQAEAKAHSAISDAILVAKAMKAKALILTHFSQRYPKLPNMDNLEANQFELAAENAMRKLKRLHHGAKRSVYNDEIHGFPEEASSVPPKIRTVTGSSIYESKDSVVMRDPDKSVSSMQQVDDTRPRSPARHNDGLANGVRSSVNKNPRADRLRVCAAFDYMRIKVGDIAKLEAYSPAFVELFPSKQDDQGSTECKYIARDR